MTNPSQRKPINRFYELHARAEALGYTLQPSQSAAGWGLVNPVTRSVIGCDDLDAVEVEIEGMENE